MSDSQDQPYELSASVPPAEPRSLMEAVADGVALAAAATAQPPAAPAAPPAKDTLLEKLRTARKAISMIHGLELSPDEYNLLGLDIREELNTHVGSTLDAIDLMIDSLSGDETDAAKAKILFTNHWGKIQALGRLIGNVF